VLVENTPVGGLHAALSSSAVMIAAVSFGNGQHTGPADDGVARQPEPEIRRRLLTREYGRVRHLTVNLGGDVIEISRRNSGCGRVPARDCAVR